MTAPRDFCDLNRWFRRFVARFGRFTHRIYNARQLIGGNSWGGGMSRRRAIGGLFGRACQVDHLPSARSREPIGMDLAQVVTVRLGLRRKRAKHSGGICIHVRQRGNGGFAAGGPRTGPRNNHKSDRTAPNGAQARHTPNDGQVVRGPEAVQAIAATMDTCRTPLQ